MFETSCRSILVVLLNKIFVMIVGATTRNPFRRHRLEFFIPFVGKIEKGKFGENKCD